MKKGPVSTIATVLDTWAEHGKRSAIKLAGNSMWPLLGDGSAVVTEHGSKGIHFGNIVVFRHRDTLIAHRVVRVCMKAGKRQYITKGDRSLKYDPQRLDEDKIIGKVVGVVKGAKINTLQTKYWDTIGFLLAVISSCVGSVFAVMKRLK